MNKDKAKQVVKILTESLPLYKNFQKKFVSLNTVVQQWYKTS